MRGCRMQGRRMHGRRMHGRRASRSRTSRWPPECAGRRPMPGNRTQGPARRGRMRPVLIVLAGLAALFLASIASVYSYGRFAKRAQGEPSAALPVSDHGTSLDELVAPLLKHRPDQSGLMLITGNVAAFAVRALPARRAGRRLALQSYIVNHHLTGRLPARTSAVQGK